MKKIVFIALLFLFGFSSCKKKETTWDSDWVVPILNDTLSLNKFENDSTLAVDEFSNYEVNLTRTIYNIGLSDFLELPDTTIIQDYILAVPSVSITPGLTIVNQIEEHTIEIPDNVQLKKVRVSNGVIKLKVFNPLETEALFTVELPGVEKDGVVFSQNYTAPPATASQDGVVTAELDISGYWLDLRGINEDSYNVLQSKLLVTSSPSGPTVTLTNQDVIKVQADFKNVLIDYARGYFGNKTFLDTSTVSYLTSDILNLIESGSIDFPGTDLSLDIENGLKVTAKATLLKISNTNASGNTIYLSSPQMGYPLYIDQASGSWTTLTPATETIEFNPGNSNLESFLENMGREFSVIYKLELNPWGNVSGGWDEVFPNSRLKIKMRTEMPLTLGLDNLTLRDTFDFSLTQDEKKSHIESGSFVLNATNAFPFKGQFILLLLDENDQLLHTVNGSSPIQSSLYGTVDSIDGLKKMKSEMQIPLSAEVINDLDLIKKVCVRVILDSTDPSSGLNQPVSIPAGAFMSMKVKGMFRLKNVLK